MKAPAPYKKRSRVLSDDELKKIWRACPDNAYGRVVKLLMLTGQRLREITDLSHNMVGADSICLPSELTKNGREHTFPLGEEARKMLVWPLKWSGFSKAKKQLDKASGVSNWRLHDLRRTFRTNLSKLGVMPHISERLVNHISSQSEMEQTYDLWKFMPEMRAAIDAWESNVRNLTSDPVVYER